MSSVETTGGRGERRGRRPARVAGDITQLPWKQPRNLLPPVELVSADQLESIHEAALTILEEIGMDVLLPEARDIYRAAGRGSTGCGCAPTVRWSWTPWPGRRPGSPCTPATRSAA